MLLSQQPESTYQRVSNWLEANGEGAIALTGLNDACIGVFHDAHNDCYRLVYSVEKVIEVLIEGGMSHDDAVEHYSYNVEVSCVGNTKPILVA